MKKDDAGTCAAQSSGAASCAADSTAAAPCAAGAHVGELRGSELLAGTPGDGRQRGIDAPGVELRERGAKMAQEAGLCLDEDTAGLFLTDGEMSVRADFSPMLPRIRQGAVRRELLVRAAKVKGAEGSLLAFDATAGFGDDALLLAAAGFEVVLCERNPVVAALLADALARAAADPALSPIVARMRLVVGDSVAVLADIAEHVGSGAEKPSAIADIQNMGSVARGDCAAGADAERADPGAGGDCAAGADAEHADPGAGGDWNLGVVAGRTPHVVLLDPMFPERRKSAAVKKKLQLIQRIEAPCDDEAALLSAALGAACKKVVIKRPAKGPHLAGRVPAYSLAGKAVRYDCYLPNNPIPNSA